VHPGIRGGQRRREHAAVGADPGQDQSPAGADALGQFGRPLAEGGGVQRAAGGVAELVRQLPDPRGIEALGATRVAIITP
jgi:hypothetical protein